MESTVLEMVVILTEVGKVTVVMVVEGVSSIGGDNGRNIGSNGDGIDGCGV